MNGSAMTPAPQHVCCPSLLAAVTHSAKLLAAEWNLRAPTVQVLQLNQPTVIDGVTVTALDANHCPGAVMLLFEVRTAQGTVKRILHTGDCRWAAFLPRAA
jgi:Cft2 family RNA processing exonuclease